MRRNSGGKQVFKVLAKFLSAALLSLAVSACTVFGGKAAEEPPYRVVLKEGAIEIREYEAFSVAETTVEQPFDEAVRVGFRRLFEYISGANNGGVEIVMTAPVVLKPEGFSATAPMIAAPLRGVGVLEGGAKGWTMAFVLPGGYRAESAPQPRDALVKLRDLPARRVAVIRYSGLLRERTGEAKRRILAKWIEEKGLAHAGDWRMAGYNPPWTLPPLRRNEVFVTLR